VRIRLLTAAGMAWLACAAPRPTVPQIDDETASARQASAEARRGAEALDAELSTSAEACPRRCSLAQNVCELGGRLCDIAARHPGDPELTSLCAEGRARCERAREKTGPCGCAAAP
jgi:hypothetical protein